MTYQNDNDLLTIVHRPLKFWLCIIILIYAGVFFASVSSTEPFYEPNAGVFRNINWFHFVGVVLAIITGFISGAETPNAMWNSLKLFTIILLSIILLSVIVFLTGGFLDSPFNGALSLFIGCFILMGRQGGLKAVTFLVLLTLALLALPYLLLRYFSYPSIHILHWKTNNLVTWLRLGISATLLIFTGIVGAQVGKKVAMIPSADLS